MPVFSQIEQNTKINVAWGERSGTGFSLVLCEQNESASALSAVWGFSDVGPGVAHLDTLWTSSFIWRQLDFRKWKTIYTEQHTKSWCILVYWYILGYLVYFSPSSLFFLVGERLVGTGFSILILWTTLCGQSCAQVRCPQWSWSTVKSWGGALPQHLTWENIFCTLLCFLSPYNEYLAVQWDIAHLELMDSSETPLCGKSLKKKKKKKTFVLVGIFQLAL